MQMELISNTHIPDGLLAAMTLLSEKPRQGVPSRKSALHPGIDERNCTAVLGLRFGWSGIVSGTVVAPKNVVKKLACAAKYGQAHSIGALLVAGQSRIFLGLTPLAAISQGF
jgi:hypothetical protein